MSHTTQRFWCSHKGFHLVDLVGSTLIPRALLFLHHDVVRQEKTARTAAKAGTLGSSKNHSVAHLACSNVRWQFVLFPTFLSSTHLFWVRCIFHSSFSSFQTRKIFLIGIVSRPSSSVLVTTTYPHYHFRPHCRHCSPSSRISTSIGLSCCDTGVSPGSTSSGLCAGIFHRRLALPILFVSVSSHVEIVHERNGPAFPSSFNYSWSFHLFGVRARPLRFHPVADDLLRKLSHHSLQPSFAFAFAQRETQGSVTWW